MQSTLRPHAGTFTVALFKEPIMAGSHTAQAKGGTIRREASSQTVWRKRSSWPELADRAISANGASLPRQTAFVAAAKWGPADWFEQSARDAG